MKCVRSTLWFSAECRACYGRGVMTRSILSRLFEQDGQQEARQYGSRCAPTIGRDNALAPQVTHALGHQLANFFQ
jgi:hypothetical protein